MSVIPGPGLYDSADEWLVGLEKYGLAIGAKPLILGFLSLLTARGEVRAFWDQVAEWGRHAEGATISPTPTIEEALRAAWPILTQKV